MAMKFKLNDPAKAKDFFENKIAFTTGPAEVEYLLKQGELPNLIDVRAAQDYEEGHVPGAINLPEDEWATLKGLSQDKLNVVYCYSTVCHLAARAAAFFASKGFSVMEMDGGFNTWKE